MPTEPAGGLLGFLANLLGLRPTSPRRRRPRALHRLHELRKT